MVVSVGGSKKCMIPLASNMKNEYEVGCVNAIMSYAVD